MQQQSRIATAAQNDPIKINEAKGYFDPVSSILSFSQSLEHAALADHNHLGLEHWTCSIKNHFIVHCGTQIKTMQLCRGDTARFSDKS